MAKKLRKNLLFKKGAHANNVTWTISYIYLAIICLFQIFIFAWMIYTSFKDDIDLYLDMFALPKLNALHFENYSNVFKLINMEIFTENRGYVTYDIWDMALNSVLMATLMPIHQIFATVCTAYVISKYRFKGKELLLMINLFVMVFPIVGNLASGLKINHAIGRFDNLFMMCIMGGHPFGMQLLIYINMFNGIDKTYMEAAQLDGAGHFRIFCTIMVPMVKSTVIVFYVLAVLGNWSNYQTPLIWLPSYPNLALGIYDFQYNAAKYAATLPQVLAGFVIISLPSIIFYFCNQKLIASKMVVGGLKG